MNYVIEHKENAYAKQVGVQVINGNATVVAIYWEPTQDGLGWTEEFPQYNEEAETLWIVNPIY